MGAIASRQMPETQKDSKYVSELPPESLTPKNARVLLFDPRSPSENVTRTPITISDTLDENGAPSVKSLKTLPIDPRSPTSEITRTPLLVEEPNDKRYQPLKPSKLVEISFTNSTAGANKDPRSPTEKVPRTPLEEGCDPTENPLCLSDQNSDQNRIHSDEDSKEISQDPKINLNKKLFESLDKDRRPLIDVQNKTPNQPKNQLQALQCRNVEEEFAKNEKMILNKLDGGCEEELKTSTEFVENI